MLIPVCAQWGKSRRNDGENSPQKLHPLFGFKDLTPEDRPGDIVSVLDRFLLRSHCLQFLHNLQYGSSTAIVNLLKIAVKLKVTYYK